MKAHDDINRFKDIGIVAGSYTRMEFACYYADGDPIPLNSVSSFGCTFSLLGSEDTSIFSIIGTIDATNTVGNIMIIDIASTDTANLDDCVLVYYPYVISDGKPIRPGYGKLFIAKAPILD